MSSRIIIDNLKNNVLIGIHENERNFKQNILINLNIEVNNEHLEDRIENVLDYEVIINKIKTSVKDKNFYLLESIANLIADVILKHKFVIQVKVGVYKPKLFNTNKIGIEIERSN